MKRIIDESKLRLVVFDSAKELGEKVDELLVSKDGFDPKYFTYMLPIKQNFFEDGHLKVEINETVRGKDVYFITDIGNYSVEYKMHGFINHTSPNDLIMQLKDGIGACNHHAQYINIVMPLLYAGRQHRRNTRENLTCGMVLHELDEMQRIKAFLTFDAHDQGVEHACPHMEFDNFFPTNYILKELINDLSIEELNNIVFVAPDNGATGRRNVYLNSFNSENIHREAGSFVKQRDYNHLVDGKYPIISHDYSGNSNIKGYTAIISDDMISSGGSMFDCIDELNNLNVHSIYIIVTYALFTKGVEKFNKYYEEGKLKGVYTTNLSYIPKEYLNLPWLHVCDCSELVADVIHNVHYDKSISEIMTDKSYPQKLLKKRFNQR